MKTYTEPVDTSLQGSGEMLLFTTAVTEHRDEAPADLFPGIPMTPFKESLAFEIHAIGIPETPQIPYHRHRAKLLAPHRIGAGGTLWPIGVSIGQSKTLAVFVFGLVAVGIYAIGFGMYMEKLWLLASGLLLGTLGYFLAECTSKYGQHWRKVAAFDLSHKIWIPKVLFERAKLAATIPTAQVYIELFETDPLLVVIRNDETYYLGGWNTGDPEIDTDV